MRGGCVPGGNWRSTEFDTAVTCATASSIFAVGWKKTLTIELPRSDCDSMCSMSLTVVVSDRS